MKKEKPIVYKVVQLLEKWSAKLTESKRVWVVVLLYHKGKIVAEGRAACCKADLDNGAYNSTEGFAIAEGRARLAERKKKSYGKLPDGYYKGAYYGIRSLMVASRPLLPFPIGFLAAMAMCKPPIDFLITDNLSEIDEAMKGKKCPKYAPKLKKRSRAVLKRAVRKCAHQQ